MQIRTSVPLTLLATFSQAFLREDAGFHAHQMLEAGASCGSLQAVVVVNCRVAV
jgi:hypothetical protein